MKYSSVKDLKDINLFSHFRTLFCISLFLTWSYLIAAQSRNDTVVINSSNINLDYLE